jgi:O-antigen/teichoic acid export membrane protein
MLKSALLILSGNAAFSLFLLIRNLAVATLIPLTDYAIAATFMIAMTAVEMASTLGLQQQIVQASKGEDHRFQAALQGFQVFRGVLAGVVLFAMAGPLAAFMGVPQVAWAYQVLAVVPVLNALQHFDMHRLNRQMVFGPLILTKVVPIAVSLLLVWPLAAWLGDYRVMLWALVVQAVVMMVSSHVTAKRSYRLVWDRAVIGESLRFGWPLLLNGAFLFGVFQGDKIIVGHLLGLEPLALFAMGFTLTLAPSLVMANSIQNFFLPQLSRGDERFGMFAQVTSQTGLFGGMVLVIAVAALGPPLVSLVLGAKYIGLEPLLVPLAVLQAIRIAKAGPSIVAMSKGHTTNAMWGNVPRLISLIVIWIVLHGDASLITVIWIGCLGELAGLIVAAVLMYQRTGVMLAWRPFAGAVLFWGIAVSATGWMLWIGLIGACVITLGMMRDLRLYAGRKAPV